MQFRNSQKETTLIVITPGKFYAKRLSSVSNAEAKYWRLRI
jgi:hypothetical protein